MSIRDKLKRLNEVITDALIKCSELNELYLRSTNSRNTSRDFETISIRFSQKQKRLLLA